MERRTALQLLLASPLAFGQNAPGTLTASAPKVPDQPPAVLGPLDYVCPMDKDIRSDQPGVCPRCGMKLILGIPDQQEFLVDLTLSPAEIHPGEKVRLSFRIVDPRTPAPVSHFEIVHEKLFHMFVVSQDLQYFLHDHPVYRENGLFDFDIVFPKPGLYRILADFYPSGATPQLITKTVIVPAADGSIPPFQDVVLKPQLEPQQAANLTASLRMEPEKPISGMKTLMFFHLDPSAGLQKYIGAWAHMLAVSDDLVDTIHNHPFLADGGPDLQFNMIFPRARTYRVWVQFQRKNVVNTVAFNVPVSELK